LFFQKSNQPAEIGAVIFRGPLVGERIGIVELIERNVEIGSGKRKRISVGIANARRIVNNKIEAGCQARKISAQRSSL